MPNTPKWFSFDPTIHAGHILTASSIILCAIGTYIGVISDIAFLKQENSRREAEITEIKTDVSQRNSMIDGKLEKMHDDMEKWFVLLDQKLDNKADKK